MTEETDAPEIGPAAQRQTWITPLFVMICVGIHIGLLMREDRYTWETLARFGHLTAERIWGEGGYWAILTTTFVHLEIWHLAFNMYWLWVLGSKLELAIGWWRFMLFYLAAAFIASAFQLAVSDTTGIGASGAVYAIFGFMWIARARYPGFAELMNDKTVKLFLVWLVVCIVMTRLNLLPVANTAHFAGLLFGAAIAEATGKRHRTLASVGSVVLVILAIVPLFWCPWSAAWLKTEAYREHAAQHYEKAIAFYDRVLEKEPQNSWAYQNRSYAHQSIGDMKGAREDLEKARAIDPSIPLE
ncbi:rhomboid family intramembrane serine protease [Haloferula sp. BvORR071]|uniref:rhomboid family intramembrane serine protease n=1 Tax=Haloferula sp. BvORR071 TaxID=1396141 RepID=UPI00054DB2D8|nr:rhomboid family intramembrane serine protease [Haloferula sp. BvORR071]